MFKSHRCERCETQLLSTSSGVYEKGVARGQKTGASYNNEGAEELEITHT